MVVKLTSWAVPSEATRVFSHPHASQSHRQNTHDLNGANTEDEHKRGTRWLAIRVWRHSREIWISSLWNSKRLKDWSNVEFDCVRKNLNNFTSRPSRGNGIKWLVHQIEKITRLSLQPWVSRCARDFRHLWLLFRLTNQRQAPWNLRGRMRGII